ncbi:MAG: TRAP transporter large permease [Oscillospiraceae bacterium]|nr:TRAP transporter large permease [Oscillospiraceae bacterium]
MITILIVVFLVLLLVGLPIAFCMGIGSFLALAVHMPQAVVTIIAKMFGGLDSFSLMAVPFFILAGNLMDASGISRKLVRFAELLVGRIKGGLSMAGVVSGVIFAGVSGSASADTSAIAAILVPPMTDEGYEKGWSSCLIATTGMLGPIIPPSILAILYSAATGLSVGALFMSGVIPGLLIAAGLLFLCARYAKTHPKISQAAETRERVGFKAGMMIFLGVLPALLMPVIIIGGILTGVFTATESAAIACIYAILYGMISRRLSLKKMWDCLGESAVTIAKLMLIVCLATLFGWILSVNNFPVMVRDALLSVSSNSYVIMLLVLALLLFVGCFMETIAALTILVPVLAPIAVAYNINSIHFAMFMIIALLIGGITPPVGINLYITTSVAKIRFSESLKYLMPFLLISLVAVLAVLFIPALTTLIPSWLGYITH